MGDATAFSPIISNGGPGTIQAGQMVEEDPVKTFLKKYQTQIIIGAAAFIAFKLLNMAASGLSVFYRRMDQMAPPPPRRALDLFTGQGSIARYFRANGYDHDDVVTLDIDPKSKATHTVDILQWDYKAAYPPGHFLVIWASPCCTHFSRARTTGPPRDLDGANALVKRTLEIISYFKPKLYCIENPACGMLKDQDYMQMIPSVIADYCAYSTPPDDVYLYRKRSQFWLNNVKVLADPPKLCDGACIGIQTPVPGAPEGRKTHAVSFGGKRTATRFMLKSNCTLAVKHRVPQALLAKLLTQ